MENVREKWSKVVFFGEANVGKTSIITQRILKTFRPYDASVMGVSPISKVTINGKIVKLEIWDTAGQERYRSFSPIHFRGAYCCVLVYDITNYKSFESLDAWRNEFLLKRAPKNPETFPIIVLGNKIDKEDERQVDFITAQEWCQRNGNMLFLEVSAKKNSMIEEAFVKMAELIENYLEEDYDLEKVVIKSQVQRDGKLNNNCAC